MVRSVEEIEDILDEIRKKVIISNRLDELDKLLEQWGFTDFIQDEPEERYKSGKIVVIGGSDVEERILVGICKAFNIGKDRLEFCLDYNKAQKYDYRKLRHNPSYSVVLFGSVPHSATGKSDAGSVIAEIEKQSGYPPVKRLMAGNELKITKSNFKIAIKELLDDKIINADY